MRLGTATCRLLLAALLVAPATLQSGSITSAGSIIRTFRTAVSADEQQAAAALTVLVGLDTRAVATRPGTAIELTPPVRHSNSSILEVDRPYEGSNRTNLGSGGITYATVLRSGENDSYM